MFVHPSGLTYSQTTLNLSMAQPLVGTSGCQLKQFSLVQSRLLLSLQCLFFLSKVLPMIKVADMFIHPYVDILWQSLGANFKSFSKFT
nr:unnamed protein product [Callosobruchus analis]